MHMEQFFRLAYLRKREFQNVEAIRDSFRSGHVEHYEESLVELGYKEQEYFRTVDGLNFKIYTRSLKNHIPCAVRVRFNCPHCTPDSPKFNHDFRDHPEYDRKLTSELRSAIFTLEMKLGDGKFADIRRAENQLPPSFTTDSESLQTFSTCVGELREAVAISKLMQSRSTI